MMKNKNALSLGVDYDSWYGYGRKEMLVTDISPCTNSHMILSGISGSGKSYALIWLLKNVILADSSEEAKAKGKIFFADFKQDDSFVFLRKCSHYYPYQKSVEALERVYEILHKRQSGEDLSRQPVTLVWDEYMANILSLQGEDKKKAVDVMNKVSEILMLGRSLAVRFICSCQRPDAKAFPDGSRLNYGVIMILGAPMRSIYEMLLPRECIDMVENRKFGRGEGVVLLQGSELHFVKVPVVRNVERMQQICMEALS